MPDETVEVKKEINLTKASQSLAQIFLNPFEDIESDSSRHSTLVAFSFEARDWEKFVSLLLGFVQLQWIASS